MYNTTMGGHPGNSKEISVILETLDVPIAQLSMNTTYQMV